MEDPSDDIVCDYGLYLLDQNLNVSGRLLASDFPSMPRPLQNWEQHTPNPLIAQELAYNRDAELRAANHNVGLLNVGQLHAFNVITQAAINRTAGGFFLHGAAGTGELPHVLCALSSVLIHFHTQGKRFFI